MAGETVLDEKSSHLGMSDDDFLNATAPPESGESATANAGVDDVQSDEPVVAVSTDDDADEPTEVVDGEDDEPVPGAAKGTGEADETGVKVDKAPDVLVDENGDKPEVKKEAPVDVNYQAEYERLLKPFKANGRDVAVNSVDDAISLMQMGANYNKKMAGLKPSLKILKLLENNNLLDEGKLSYLIDLDRKDPNAINKLIKDSGLNPMDLDADKAGDYVPKTHHVDERELDLDTVLDEIQNTPTYNQTLDLISKKWDGPSKQAIAGAPQLIKVLNDHISSGIYSLISAEVDRERMFGRLDGLSDLEAYRKIGDDIQARGGFNQLGAPQGKPAGPPVVVTPKPKADNESLNEKRRAAGSTPAGVTAPTKEFNPLAMSDAEFSKAAVPRF
jgi:hypothetical protein